MFKADRVYSEKNPRTGTTEWYFQAREGNAGPFQTKQSAELKLKQFIKACIDADDDGGRNPKNTDAAKQAKKQTLLDFKITDQIDWY